MKEVPINDQRDTYFLCNNYRTQLYCSRQKILDAETGLISLIRCNVYILFMYTISSSTVL